MDFLQIAAVLVPALTGIALTVFDGNQELLDEFEANYCFSPGVQRCYTAKALTSFLDGASTNTIYEIIEPLKTRLLIFHCLNRWVLLGPYVECGWDECAAIHLLCKLKVPNITLPTFKSYQVRLPISGQDYAMRIALLIVKHTDGGEMCREDKIIGIRHGDEKLPPVGGYEEIAIINRRYNLEEQFIKAISLGEAENACHLLVDLHKECLELRFLSDSLHDQYAGAGIIRTLIRLGAKAGGMSPVLIDSISQDFALRMKRAVTAEAIYKLVNQMIVYICNEIQRAQQSGFSPYVKKALDYMDANFSRTITVKELSEVVGLNKADFAQEFCHQTGSTVKQYLAKKRTDTAKELLSGSSLTIQEIASFVGYIDNNYFSKVFKANVGISPQKYRKEHWHFS